MTPKTQDSPHHLLPRNTLTAFLIAHNIVLLFIFQNHNIDAVMLRSITISPSVFLAVFAAIAIGSLFLLDIVVARTKFIRTKLTLCAYWLISTILCYVYANTEIPTGIFMKTFQIDSVFFRLLPVYLFTPMLALQELIYCMFPLFSQNIKQWLLQYAGLIFSAGHFLYFFVLLFRIKRMKDT